LGGSFAGNGGGGIALDYSGGTPEAQPSALQEVAAGATTVGVGTAAAGPNGEDVAAAPEVVETVVKDERTRDIGRNDPCWCGSGKKYKKCHGA
jgi:preprotein translocase subunit SecA